MQIKFFLILQIIFTTFWSLNACYVIWPFSRPMWVVWVILSPWSSIRNLGAWGGEVILRICSIFSYLLRFFLLIRDLWSITTWPLLSTSLICLSTPNFPYSFPDVFVLYLPLCPSLLISWLHTLYIMCIPYIFLINHCKMWIK